MKNLILILLFIFSARTSFGQACGIYRINYVGQIVSNSNNIIKIKLPNTFYLHSKETEDSKLDFLTSELDEGNFNIEIRSHLTSIYSNSQKLKETYKSKRSSIPIILILENNGQLTEKIIIIDWNQVEISIINDEKLGNLFKVDLGKITF